MGGWVGVPPTHVHTHAHTCMHVHVCTCVEGTLLPPLPHPPTPTPRGTPRISKISIALELIEIFQFCLKIYDF